MREFCGIPIIEVEGLPPGTVRIVQAEEARRIVLGLLLRAYSYKTSLEAIAYYAALFGALQSEDE